MKLPLPVVFIIIQLHEILSLKGNNVCQEQQTYKVNVTKLVPRNLTVRHYKWCFNMPPRCSYYALNETIEEILQVEEKQKNVSVCCPGYIKRDEECVSVCKWCTETCNFPSICDPLSPECTSPTSSYCPESCTDLRKRCDVIEKGPCTCPPGLKDEQCSSNCFDNIITTTSTHQKQNLSSHQTSASPLSTETPSPFSSHQHYSESFGTTKAPAFDPVISFPRRHHENATHFSNSSSSEVTPLTFGSGAEADTTVRGREIKEEVRQDKTQDAPFTVTQQVELSSKAKVDGQEDGASSTPSAEDLGWKGERGTNRINTPVDKNDYRTYGFVALAVALTGVLTAGAIVTAAVIIVRLKYGRRGRKETRCCGAHFTKTDAGRARAVESKESNNASPFYGAVSPDLICHQGVVAVLKTTSSCPVPELENFSLNFSSNVCNKYPSNENLYDEIPGSKEEGVTSFYVNFNSNKRNL